MDDVGDLNIRIRLSAVRDVGGRHFKGKPIAGSCGGLNGSKVNEDGSMSCSICSNPSDGCQELREKMEQAKGVGGA